MSKSNSPPSTPPQSDSSRRRASFSHGTSFAELFSRSGNTNASGQSPGTPAFPSAMASVAQNQNRRRVSITTLGLSGSPNQSSPFGGFTRRRGSISSSQGSGSPQFEEAVVEENENAAPVNTPNTPFARRVSFGAQALREVRSGSGSNSNGTRHPSHTLASSPPAAPAVGKGRGLSASSSPTPTENRPPLSPTSSFHMRGGSNSWRSIGEGFNWSDALRDKAGRAPSIGGGLAPTSSGAAPAHPTHGRAASLATMEPPKEMPAPKAQPPRPKPDPTQERILRGDFYMD